MSFVAGADDVLLEYARSIPEFPSEGVTDESGDFQRSTFLDE